MAFKLKNSPEKMFHKAEGQVQQPQLPGLKEEGSYAGNPDGAGKYGKNPEAAGKVSTFPFLPIAGAIVKGVMSARGKSGKSYGGRRHDQRKAELERINKGKNSSSNNSSSNNSSSNNSTSKPAKGSSTKITGAIGSDLRKQQYDAKGWKYDHTIAGDHEGAYKKPSKSTTPKTDTTPKVDTKPKTDTTPKADTTVKTPKKETSPQAAKLRAKGEAALESGNVKKAQRLRKRYDRKTARDNKKADRKAKRQAIKNIRKGNTPDYSGSPAQKKYCKK